MAKKSVTQRRLDRVARRAPQNDLPGTSDAGSIPSGGIPHQVITDAPPAGTSMDMAAGGEPLVRGNSDRQPLNATGHATAARVGDQLAALGGPSLIAPSGAIRTQQTAQEVASKTGAPMAPPDPDLESHALGQLEGDPKTPEVRRYLADLMRKQPDFRIPGQGAQSSRPGESFNEFRTRALSAVRGLMQYLAAHPTQQVLVPTSSQVEKLVDAWVSAGTPDDLSVSPDAYLKESAGKPGDMKRFFPGADGAWGLTSFKPQSASSFPPGIYFMRHGETDSVQANHASASQSARAQIVSHVRSANWRGARDAAKTASSSGHLSDQEISDAIDEGLPTAEDAPRLAPHELLAAASAASPARRAEFQPLIDQKFGNMDGMSQMGRHAILSHLGRIGALPR
jgi:broad specificity phosphatase PhoE